MNTLWKVETGIDISFIYLFWLTRVQLQLSLRFFIQQTHVKSGTSKMTWFL